MRSVFANTPVALAKSRTWRGLITATLISAALELSCCQLPEDVGGLHHNQDFTARRALQTLTQLGYPRLVVRKRKRSLIGQHIYIEPVLRNVYTDVRIGLIHGFTRSDLANSGSGPGNCSDSAKQETATTLRGRLEPRLHRSTVSYPATPKQPRSRQNEMDKISGKVGAVQAGVVFAFVLAGEPVVEFIFCSFGHNHDNLVPV
jgi:hypothetical protein